MKVDLALQTDAHDAPIITSFDKPRHAFGIHVFPESLIWKPVCLFSGVHVGLATESQTLRKDLSSNRCRAGTNICENIHQKKHALLLFR